MTTFASSALLRTAGFPVRLWLAAGAPDLFELLRRLDSCHHAYRELARGLAERIGNELVPHPTLSGQDRNRTLAVRRRLHGGASITMADGRHLVEIAARLLPNRGLAAELTSAAELSSELSELEGQAASAVTAEQERLLSSPWELLRESPVGQRALSDGSLAAADDVQRRLDAGEPWTSKRLRRRSDYLWRMIARGAAKTPPRSWLGHVSLVPVHGHGPDLSSLDVTGEVAAEWIENIHLKRCSLAERAGHGIDPEAHVGLTPLHRLGDDQLRAWAIDPGSPDRLTEVHVRHTPVLGVIHTALRTGARPLAELEAAILPAAAERQREVLRSFLTHLVGLGVLQLSMPPRRHRTGWQALATASGAVPEPGGFLDIYRQTNSALPANEYVRLQHAVEQALRVFALIEADRPAADHQQNQEIDERPRPVLDIFAERLDAYRSIEHADHETDWSPGWPAARTSGSGYQRLLDSLGSHADTFDITPDLLDELEAPATQPHWPFDCLVRPTASGGAVLDGIAPAGVLDSRFDGQLHHLHGPVPHARTSRSGPDVPGHPPRGRATGPRNSFQNMSFAYPDGEGRVFDRLDLALPAGRSLALVGDNGEGKTTLIKLLARLYDPDGGRIAVDGVDLAELEPDAWRRQLAVVFQDFCRYELPARDNMGFGRIDAPRDDEALATAARLGGISDVITGLPGGWDTPLSRQYTDGAELSGGQWQRLALSRAMFAVEHGARVLILDEPTAHLDVRAESDLYERFLDLTRGLTTILVSHRFATVRLADQIAVLGNGRVAEHGTHDELLDRGGHYARMFELQAAPFQGGIHA
jgi:ABC-type multidrug transport system fused ATPase/permease subunit